MIMYDIIMSHVYMTRLACRNFAKRCLAMESGISKGVDVDFDLRRLGEAESLERSVDDPGGTPWLTRTHRRDRFHEQKTLSLVHDELFEYIRLNA